MTINNILDQQRAYFNSHVTLELKFRKEQLIKLKKLLINEEDAFYQALYQDMKKPYFEAYGGEISFIVKQIDYMLGRLRRFCRPQKVKAPIAMFPGKCLIYPRPYGVCLIISPFNFPLYLSLVPLVGAMAAGNTIILKPSSRSASCTRLLVQLLNQHFDSRYLKVVDKKIPEYEGIMDQKYDYIFFTGSAETGSKLMSKAAKNLIPLTLELGGKNPCIFDRSIDLAQAVKSLVWGKFFNAGQACIAPDFLLVPKEDAQEVYALIKQSISEFYGPEPKDSPHFARVIDERHLNELLGLIDSNNLLCGGDYDLEQLYLAPTVMKDVGWKHKSMEKEIFGPILPILPYDNLENVFEELIHRPSPLSFYLFSNNKELVSRCIEEIPAGSVVANDLLMQGICNELPFGGVGYSGMGKYHGYHSFRNFSNYKSVLCSRSIPWFSSFRFPPYNMKKKMVHFFFKWFS